MVCIRAISWPYISAIYQRSGIQTAIVDYTDTGESAASFLSVLFDWAKEEGVDGNDLAQCLRMHALIRKSSKTLTSIRIPEEGIEVRATTQLAQEHPMAELVNTHGSRRILPECPYWNCKTKPM